MEGDRDGRTEGGTDGEGRDVQRRTYVRMTGGWMDIQRISVDLVLNLSLSSDFNDTSNRR